jgi:uncharacterized protein HemY
MLIVAAIIVWLIVGFYAVRIFHAGDWLIMMTDRRNTPRTWMALPSMVLCWVLWPICAWLARHLFYLSISWLPKETHERRIRDSIMTIDDFHMPLDFEMNSLYPEVMKVHKPDEIR